MQERFKFGAFEFFNAVIPDNPVRGMTQDERLTMMIVGLLMQKFGTSEVTITIPEHYIINSDCFVKEVGTVARHNRQRNDSMATDITFKLIPPEIVIDAEIVEDTKLIEVKNAGD